MSAAIDVSVLVVSYNTREMTLAALRSLARETTATRLEVIVIDNASKDGSAEAIAAEPGARTLIALDENIGFAAANNLAAARAEGRYILLLNPDTLVRDAAVDRLVAFARENPHARIWGGRTLFADGRLNPSSCWRRMTLWNLFCRASGLTGLFPDAHVFNGEAYGGWPRDAVREVDIVSGCFFLVERGFWQRLGGFDKRFFMYGEEADLCLRAKRLGARPMVTPAATIVHYGGASETARAGKLVKLMAAKAALIERHFTWPARPLALALHAAWPLSRMLALQAAQRFTGIPRHAEAAAVWTEVWRRRSEWRHGWPEPNPPSPRVAAASPL